MPCKRIYSYPFALLDGRVLFFPSTPLADTSFVELDLEFVQLQPQIFVQVYQNISFCAYIFNISKSKFLFASVTFENTRVSPLSRSLAYLAAHLYTIFGMASITVVQQSQINSSKP